MAYNTVVIAIAKTIVCLLGGVLVRAAGSRRAGQQLQMQTTISALPPPLGATSTRPHPKCAQTTQKVHANDKADKEIYRKKKTHNVLLLLPCSAVCLCVFDTACREVGWIGWGAEIGRARVGRVRAVVEFLVGCA